MARPWMAAVALAAACLVVGAEGGRLTNVMSGNKWYGAMFGGRRGTGSDRVLHQGMGHSRMRRNAEKAPAQVNDSAPAQATDAISSHKGITCEWRKNHMKCKNGVIRVKSAMYGRTDKKVCGRGRPAAQLEKTDCTSDKTELVSRCNNRTECATRVTNKVMDEDPCKGTFKYLRVKWDCIKKPDGKLNKNKKLRRRRTRTKRKQRDSKEKKENYKEKERKKKKKE